MKFKIGTITFVPLEVIRKPSGILSLLLLFIFFSNVVVMWGDALSNRSPYGSSEDFQTLDAEFKYTLQLSKFTTPEEEILALNNAFDKFKEEHPKYKSAILYRTSEYYNIHAWKFWKWYREDVNSWKTSAHNRIHLHGHVYA